LEELSKNSIEVKNLGVKRYFRNGNSFKKMLRVKTVLEAILRRTKIQQTTTQSQNLECPDSEPFIT